ncbi:uncharacterized protein M421DRAFT_101080 [Didymella exigua CBS 183.55]|uniref:Uncharacterized protein n=1 Tax=Didymella exigua CBS 183.55 TaxID=1150837 RepID=A0A6A5RIP2_9PLEO|nr:uncharacterized protein M421DRAFT_101080 [Didymella exigua CBS 183.55]KAF1928215.1 hypothetical protein M421DRAFT_101080 [Didymella exigua CBS 183.55]
MLFVAELCSIVRLKGTVQDSASDIAAREAELYPVVIDLFASRHPQRKPGRPEDNPFIAFRRYADSQVSSLLNTIFTLPAQIANYNNAHHAREQCLFGKADPKKCEELQALESHSEKLRREGTESYRAGDVHAVLMKGEQLMVLEQQAGELRRAILNDAEDSRRNSHQQKQLVEKVGNKRGQEWSDSWDWPEPTCEDDVDDNGFARWLESRAKRAGGELERMFTRLEEDASKVFGKEIEELHRHWAARYDDTHRHEDAQTRNWSRSWSWQWLPPGDAPKHGDSNATRNPYSPSTLEADERTKHMGSLWRNAFEDLMRTTQENPLLSDAQNSDFDQMGLCPLREYAKELKQLEESNKRESTRNITHDEPSYEYAHDHEDQHDDPPTPKPQQSTLAGNPSAAHPNTETELDAYERLLTTQANPSPLSSESKPTVLSTLTTTERMTATDGTITTKVVLKKRFADGSEQSSETIHTQRGEDAHQTEGPWRAMQSTQSALDQNRKPQKKSGWFWSN